MNQLANARSDEVFAKTRRGRRFEGNHSLFSCILDEVYFGKSQEDSFLSEIQSFRSNFQRFCKIFMEGQRNIPRPSFVYTGAAPYWAAQGEIQKKPRGGSRGVVTRNLSGR